MHICTLTQMHMHMCHNTQHTHTHILQQGNSFENQNAKKESPELCYCPINVLRVL